MRDHSVQPVPYPSLQLLKFVLLDLFSWRGRPRLRTCIKALKRKQSNRFKAHGLGIQLPMSESIAGQ